MVLQCVACIQKENRKFCLAAEGLGNRLCYLEPTSEAKVGTEAALLHGLILSDLRNIQHRDACYCVWDVSAELLDQKSSTSFDGVVFPAVI